PRPRLHDAPARGPRLGPTLPGRRRRASPVAATLPEVRMRFYVFHLMPWPYLPEDFAQTHDTAWVVCENSLYDPERGHELYNRYLDELALTEPLGFDGVCVNEHHQNAYGLMPSPNLIAACLSQRTS